MPTQTVYHLTSQNGFDNLQAFQEPIPEPGPGEVLIKVRSVGLNYRDIVIATGHYPLPTKPQVVPCSDMAGEVVAVGPWSENSMQGPPLAVGDAVTAPPSPCFLYGGSDRRPDLMNFAWAGAKQDGVLREYLVMPAHLPVKLPQCTSSQDFVRWAAVPGTVSTVWNTFYGNTPLKPGHTVLILGTGGTSMTALILAKAAGATTIITSSSDEKLEFVKSRYGPDYTINYKTTPEWAAEVLRITNGQGVDHVIEVGGAGTMKQSLEAVAVGGLISVIGFLSSAPEGQQPDLVMSVLTKACVVRGILGGSKQQLEEAVGFMNARGLELLVDKTFRFDRDEIIAAFNYVASGAHMGKVCITFE